MHKIKYLHGSSYFKYEDVEKDDDDGAAERPATLSTVTATESESQAEMKYWFRVWEPRARGPGPSPRQLSLIVCMWEGAHGHSVCVWAPRQDLTLRALAQLNKLTALPLPVSTELILQLGHIEKHILS